MAKHKKPHVTLAAAPAATNWDAGAAGPANRENLTLEMRAHTDPETGTKSNPNGVKGYRRETWVQRYAATGKLTTRQMVSAMDMQAAASGHPAQDVLCALKIDRASLAPDLQASRVDARARGSSPRNVPRTVLRR